MGFVSFLLYQMMLYFLIDQSAEKYMFYLPMLLKGAGVSIVYTSLTMLLLAVLRLNIILRPCALSVSFVLALAVR